MRSPSLTRLCVPAALVALALSLFPAASVEAQRLTSSELSKIKKELAAGAATESPVKLGALIKRLSRLDDPKVIPYLLKAALVIPSAKNYESAVAAVAKYKKEKTLDELIKRSSPRRGDPREGVLILEGFGKRKDAETREAIYAALESKVSLVQGAAIHACVERMEKDAVPHLIDLVERERKTRSRAWIEGRRALLALTAQDFDTHEDWVKFWESNKETLDPRKLDRSKGPTKVVVKKSSDSVEFFGKEIFSQNVVFVIDCSGSMILYDDDADYQGQNIEYDRRRLERAKRQLLSAMRQLKARSKFNIITYNNQVFRWKKQIMPATPSNFGSGGKFVKGFQANGFTHTDEALEEAFKDPNIDTIVLLSDGAPYKQGADPGQLMENILKRVKDLNAGRRLTIDTFGFEGLGMRPKSLGGGGTAGGAPAGGGGETAMVAFLKKLASENSGEYRAIK